LRHVAINGQYLRMDDVPPPDESGLRLRQHQFPRLRRLTVEDEEGCAANRAAQKLLIRVSIHTLSLPINCSQQSQFVEDIACFEV
jgi:hypothetical protein